MQQSGSPASAAQHSSAAAASSDVQLSLPPPSPLLAPLPREDQLFTIRAATIDYYMAKPRTLDVSRSYVTGNQLAKVPVVRIFGTFCWFVRFLLHLPGMPLNFGFCIAQTVANVLLTGGTPEGQRCCLHIHQAFPYCYIPCLDDMPDPVSYVWMSHFRLHPLGLVHRRIVRDTFAGVVGNRTRGGAAALPSARTAD